MKKNGSDAVNKMLCLIWVPFLFLVPFIHSRTSGPSGEQTCQTGFLQTTASNFPATPLFDEWSDEEPWFLCSTWWHYVETCHVWMGPLSSSGTWTKQSWVQEFNRWQWDLAIAWWSPVVGWCSTIGLAAGSRPNMLWRGSVARFNLSMIYFLLAWALACEAFRINQKTTIV